MAVFEVIVSSTEYTLYFVQYSYIMVNGIVSITVQFDTGDVHNTVRLIRKPKKMVPKIPKRSAQKTLKLHEKPINT